MRFPNKGGKLAYSSRRSTLVLQSGRKNPLRVPGWRSVSDAYRTGTWGSGGGVCADPYRTAVQGTSNRHAMHVHNVNDSTVQLAVLPAVRYRHASAAAYAQHEGALRKRVCKQGTGTSHVGSSAMCAHMDTLAAQYTRSTYNCALDH
eukprot:5714885-Prymnesium_polylepis.2